MTLCMRDAELHTDVTIPNIDALDLKQGLTSEEVHKRALASRSLYGKAQKALTFWIVEMDERKLYKDFGCSNVFQYATRYLDIGEHTTAEMLRTGKALAQLPLLSEAFDKGQISSSHIREISRVATEETEKFWCDAARGKTVREVEKLVAFTPRGGLPVMKSTIPQPAQSSKSVLLQTPAPVSENVLTCTCTVESAENKSAAPEMPIQQQNQVKYHEKLVVDLDAEEMSVLKDAFAKAQKESGKRDRASLLLHIAKAFLEGCSSTGARRKPRYQIVLHRHLPSGLAWCDTPKGERPVTSEVLEKALSDAEIVKLDEPGSPTWDEQNNEKETLSSFKKSDTIIEKSDIQNEALDHVNEQYMKVKAAKRKGHIPGKDNENQLRKEGRNIPAALRKKVLLRDGYTCQAPGCGRKTFLTIHHLIPFTISGIHCIGYLMVLCSGCHDLVHVGNLSVEGEAPDRLNWRNEKGNVI